MLQIGCLKTYFDILLTLMFESIQPIKFLKLFWRIELCMHVKGLRDASKPKSSIFYIKPLVQFFFLMVAWQKSG